MCFLSLPPSITVVSEKDNLFNNNNKTSNTTQHNGGSGGIKKQVIKCGLNL